MSGRERRRRKLVFLRCKPNCGHSGRTLRPVYRLTDSRQNRPNETQQLIKSFVLVVFPFVLLKPFLLDSLLSVPAPFVSLGCRSSPHTSHHLL
ncbi:hypothetical protein CCH79_00009149 [Gambusia affinis]|uniref:Uncharacterized protein n=1 Tax=Gambusia affinis TaxID=33528 RepID=A0A315W6S4_GAMAF|nr:hypothetical protein CCH79_00009149 [Gambusia affinis]